MKVLKELLITQPQLIRVELDGYNMLHFCIRHIHLDDLKILVDALYFGLLLRNITFLSHFFNEKNFFIVDKYAIGKISKVK